MCNLSRTKTIADTVSKLKTGSCEWIQNKGPQLKHFHWQAGYGAFSVCQSQVETVRAYIRNQREHHAKQSFQDELRLIFHKHGIEFDERYVWD